MTLSITPRLASVRIPSLIATIALVVLCNHSLLFNVVAQDNVEVKAADEEIAAVSKPAANNDARKDPSLPALEPLSDEQLSLFDALLVELNSPKFDVREAASEKLNGLDEQYLPLFQKAFEQQKSPDAKARIQIVMTRKYKEQQERLNRQFVLMSDNQAAGDLLPGWKSFSEASGYTDRKTKTLFLKLLKTFPFLVYKQIDTQQEAYDKAVLVASTISPRLDVSGEVTEEDGIALSYVIAMTGDKLDAGLEATALRVFSRHPFATKLTTTARTATSESGNAIISLFDKFAENAKDEYRLLSICLNAQIPVGAKVAAKYLASETATDQPEVFDLAISAMARFGKSEHIPIVEKWLNNRTIIQQGQRLSTTRTGFNALEPVEVQAGDLALATTIILHRESPHVIFPAYRSHPLRGFFTDSVGQVTGTSDEVRDELRTEWEERLKVVPELDADPASESQD